MKNNNKTTYYGVFYKSRGKWTGPYNQTLYTERERNRLVQNGELRFLASVLKSKVSVRKLS